MVTTAPFVRRWEQPALIPHPKPEVPARPAQPGEIPPAAVTLTKLAEEHGWTVDATYARGTSLGARGKPGKVVDSLALRMHRGDQRAVAMWDDGKRSPSWAWRHKVDRPPIGCQRTADQLKEWITS